MILVLGRVDSAQRGREMKKRNKKYTPKPLPARMYSWESDRGIEDRYVNAQLKLGFKWVQVAGEAAFRTWCADRLSLRG